MAASHIGTEDSALVDAPDLASDVVALLLSKGYIRRNVLRAASARILVVDDRADTVRIMVRLLQKEGYDAHGADGHSAAVVAVAGLPFDLLLTEIEMSGRCGCELLAELRGLHGVDGVAVTAAGTAADKRRTSEAGFLVHLTKPVILEDLTCAIEYAMARRESRPSSSPVPADRVTPANL